MSLPKAVQQNADAADELMNQLAGGQPGEQPPETTPTEVHEPPNAPDVPDAPQGNPAPQPTATDFEQRYRVLQGKYDAEVPRLLHQNRELEATVNQLVEQVQHLTANRTETQQKPLITDADQEAFGKDLIDLADRIAKQNMQPLLDENKQLKAELGRLTQSMSSTQQTVAVTAKQAYVNDLGRLVPNWETVNVDPGFVNWLEQIDPVLGAPRRVMLNAAFERLDAQHTASIFSAYLASLPTQAPPVKSPKDELQSQVAPTRSRAAAAPAPNDMSSRIFRESEIAKIYNDIRRNQYTVAEAERIQAEIDRAVAEGRIHIGA